MVDCDETWVHPGPPPPACGALMYSTRMHRTLLAAVLTGLLLMLGACADQPAEEGQADTQAGQASEEQEDGGY
jgi:hypothetical protein